MIAFVRNCINLYAKDESNSPFFSIVPTDKHTFLILNYSNPLDECKDWPWIWGQIAPSGTMIYAVTVAFEKQTF